MDDNKATIVFQPYGIRGKVRRGVSVIEAARSLGVEIESICGGKQLCGKCIVRIEEGDFAKYGIVSSIQNTSPWNQEVESKFINAERKAEGYRLSCVAKVDGDLVIFVPEESRLGKQVISKAPRNINIDWDPAVRLYYVKLCEPTLENPTGDFEKICQALVREYALPETIDIDIITLRNIPKALRRGNWSVTVSVWNEREIIRVQPGKIEHAYGIAFDIGTTTVAGYLCDLTNKDVITTVSMMNPQCKYGEDVMTRITFHMSSEDGLRRMSDDITACLNELISEAVAGTYPPEKSKEEGKTAKEGNAYVEHSKTDKKYLQLKNEDIEDITIVANTAMHHILLGIDPQFVSLAPFPPVIHHSMNIRARDLGIDVNPSSYAFVLPVEAGFVGADNVGVLICEEPYKSDDVQLIVDIGTNGEIILGNRHKLLSSSCATGPALEGAQISCGMRAEPGAIERIDIEPGTFEVNYKVVGRDTWSKFSKPHELKVKGICGSGILDVLAELYSSGVITKSGVFDKNLLDGHPRFRMNSNTGQFEFILAFKEESSIDREIVITQKDIRQIQLAKGALCAGCKLMIKRMGIKEPDRVKIAGSFGTHVDRVKALTMGLLPDCEIEKIECVGNAAGDGCRAALLSVKKRREADWCSLNVEYIELTREPEFEREFMKAMQLPHMTDAYSHLEGLVRPEILHQGVKPSR
jgi:uncharacterized 2Fe-2S/4Fe-4S cluster protein (DUF4445 family)